MGICNRMLGCAAVQVLGLDTLLPAHWCSRAPCTLYSCYVERPTASIAAFAVQVPKFGTLSLAA
jgi:hypothetical protein